MIHRPFPAPENDIVPFPEASLRTRRNRQKIAVIGNFPPVRCGIATFTADMVSAIQIEEPNADIDVYVTASGPELPAQVKAAIEASREGYLEAAQAIENGAPDAIWVQHEFGIFGGDAGEWIMDLLEPLSAPIAITFHTILDAPTPDQRRVMEWLVERCSRLVAMSVEGADILERVYGADPEQVIVIPHGVPDRPFGRSACMKQRFGLSGRKVAMTFGLISPGKGLETMISALPALAAEEPNILYVIAGATHPNLLAEQGEAYRETLMDLADRLGVSEHVRWENRFLEEEELLDLIEAADIYVTPYTGMGQSTSGTLSYALALGKAVVSTPYRHATELLGDGAGVLVRSASPDDLAEAIAALFREPHRLDAMQRRAYRNGRTMIWSEFGRSTLKVLDDICVNTVGHTGADVDLPEAGLLRMCDDTGMLQHSVLGVPDRAHGYCVDDNARALMLANRISGQFGRAAPVFAAFLEHSWNADANCFRNFMGFDRRWLEECGSEDSCGRVLWALGSTAADGQSKDIKLWARHMFDRAIGSAAGFGSLRATAFTMLGADRMLDADPEHKVAMQVLERGVIKLMSALGHSRMSGWGWFEAYLAYDNARLPEALLRGATRTGSAAARRDALAALDWLFKQQTSITGHFRPVGSRGFGETDQPIKPFDQQPVDAWASVDAALAAWKAEGSSRWLDAAQSAYDWFFGSNDRAVKLGNAETGTCFDGINPRGVNLNTGAESILALHLAHVALRQALAIAGETDAGEAYQSQTIFA